MIRNIDYPIVFVKLNSISINAVMCDPVHDAETVHGLLSVNSIWNPFLKYAGCMASLISKKKGFYLLLAVQNVNELMDYDMEYMGMQYYGICSFSPCDIRSLHHALVHT